MNLLYLAAIVFIITTVIYTCFSALSNKIGIYRITNDNKKIAKFAGGVLTFSFIISALLMYFEGQYFNIELTSKSVVELSICLAILFGLGYYFDNTQLVGKKKIIREALVFVLLSLVTLNTNLVSITFFSEGTNFVLTYAANLLIEIAWYLIIVNGMNVLRKIDKLVSGISFITSLSFFLLSLLLGNSEFTCYALILCTISLFLTLFNVHVNNIIGLSFGFILAYLGLNYLTAGPTLIITAIVSLSMPIFNLIYVI
ncbi:MAG: hypothetical protein MJ246_04350 [Clostridia bacterium]|nr:hypothetical protein [Clostridia bacterium]